MKKIIIQIFIAALLWFLMFSPYTSHLLNFWISMTISAIILITLSINNNKDIIKQFDFKFSAIILGLLSAVVLWLIFYLGEYFSTLLFDFARPQVDSIYSMRDGYNKILIGVGLLFIIGPAEEIFWRANIQQFFIDKYGEWKALIITTLIYALVHIWSFNFVLIMAALICGAFWGLMYRYNKNLVPLVISHAVWDVAIFIVFPIM